MKDLKILILMPYYERQNMVKNALKSILINDLTYKNWELAFIDDGSIRRGRSVVEEMLKDHLDKIKFYYINDSIEDKIKQGGSRHPEYMNKAIKESDANIAVWLMDDDAFMEKALFNLNEWFNNNPNRMYCYCDQVRFDPFSHPPKMEFSHSFSRATTVITWRIKCNKEDNIWFKSPKTLGADSPFYHGMWDKYGKNMESSGICLLYRALHKDNLGKKNPQDKDKYRTNTIPIGKYNVKDYIEYVIEDISQWIDY